MILRDDPFSILGVKLIFGDVFLPADRVYITAQLAVPGPSDLDLSRLFVDYFLLRYGPEDIGKYVRDRSTAEKYYGTLSCCF